MGEHGCRSSVRAKDSLARSKFAASYFDMKTIALEEHFVTQDFLRATNAYGHDTPPAMQAVREKLLDLGDGRVAAMDQGGVDVEVLSLAAMGVDELAPSQQTAVMRGVHDELADAVRARPERFAAFASPALKEPEKAAKELERCVRELGFVGALLDGTTDGKFLDDPRFLPVFEAAESLGVPIYLHPAPPPKAVQDAYYSGMGEAGFLLSIAGWGWHAENGLHILRLIVAGIFDRFPKLQVIIGHMGEGVPYALARSSAVLTPAAKHLERGVAETFLEQVHVTTSGYFTRPPFDCCLAVVGLDRMMYSVDYPFSANTRGKDFLASLNLSDGEMAKLTHGNARRLLGL
jgi:predicted TIM-barrel fold metal-dependent hydrolase